MLVFELCVFRFWPLFVLPPWSVWHQRIPACMIFSRFAWVFMRACLFTIISPTCLIASLCLACIYFSMWCVLLYFYLAFPHCYRTAVTIFRSLSFRFYFASFVCVIESLPVTAFIFGDLAGVQCGLKCAICYVFLCILSCSFPFIYLWV